MPVFFPKRLKIFEPQIPDSTRKYTYAQSFSRFVKENRVKCYEKTSDASRRK